MIIPIAKYDAKGRCVKAGFSLRPIARSIKRVKKELTPSKEMQEYIEWTVAGVTVVLGTVVAVEVLAAIASLVM